MKQANCKEEGMLLRTCIKCSGTEGTSIAKNGIHTEVIDEAIDASCTTDGKTEGSHCSVCGAVIIAQNTIPAHHTFSNWTIQTPPKFAYEGIEESTCICGETETRSIEKLEVSFDSCVYDPQKEYEIVFWAKNNANIQQKNALENAVKEFNLLYPNIKITVKHYTADTNIYSGLITSSQKPDIFMISPSYIPTLAESIDLVSFNGLVENNNYGIDWCDDDIFNYLLEQTEIDNNYFALPFIHATQVCYVNKTYVEKLGFEMPEVLTWDFIETVSKAALEKDSSGEYYLVNGKDKMIPIRCTVNSAGFLLGLLSNCGTTSLFNKDETGFNDNAVSCLSYIVDLTNQGLFLDNNSFPNEAFNSGECIFAFDSSTASTWYGTDALNESSENEERVVFITEVKQLPFNSIPITSTGLSIGLSNSNDADKMIASWLFAKFLLSKEVQLACSQTEGYIPARSEIINSTEYATYLSNSGKDNNLYYEVKISATLNLIDSVSNTHLVDEKTQRISDWLVQRIYKDAKLGKTLDDRYYQDVFEEIRNLFHL